ncbi:MAG: DHH family phosphoesterase [candidate division WOR-3 bacterium]
MWPRREVDETAVAALAQQARITPVMARLLWLRGVRSGTEVERWLHPSVEHFHPPELLPDFDRAVSRIEQAVARQEEILLWGHDDLDGITSVVILHRLLTDLRARVSYHIPTRGREKHGLAAAVVLARKGDPVRLVVTVDCGITNRDQVALLHHEGIEVIVTDHHEVPDPMPDAVANVDAKRPDSVYPYRGLASAGLALKLGMGLAQRRLGLTHAEFLSVQPELLALAVLGTLADRVPLTGENRTIVGVGLSRLENTRLPAVRAVLDRLMHRQRLSVSRFLADLLPLFAAAIGNEAVAKFISATREEAESWVDKLEAESRTWRAEAERTLEQAASQVILGDGILFVRGRELSLRALGFCAAKLKDQYQVPAVVMGWRGDAWIGECRGIEGVSLLDLLNALAEYLIDFGGHKKAAGFSIADDRVEDFIRAAEEYAHRNFAGRIRPENRMMVDALLPFADFDPDLAALGPFGDGNPQPVFESGPTTVVADGDVLRPAGRRELTLKAVRGALAVESGRGWNLLYTLDEAGSLTALDARPA